MKKYIFMDNLKNIAYEFLNESIKLYKNLDLSTADYIFRNLINIVCETYNSKKIETKEKIKKLINLIELESDINHTKPIINLVKKLNEVKNNL